MIPNTGISDHCVSILDEDTICAVSTPPGVGGIAVIRVSGKKAIPVTDMIFRPKGKGGDLSHRSSHTGRFMTGQERCSMRLWFRFLGHRILIRAKIR